MRMNLKRLSVRSVLLAVLLAMAACGGAGGNSNNAGGGGNPADSATFATVVSGIANSQSLLLAEPGLTSDTQVADSRTTLDKWMELLGIRSAIAQTAPLKLLYAQDGNNTLRVINMLETINASGQRSSLSIATQIQQSSSLLPRITGIMDTPAYVLMSYSLLFKPDPQTGQINRNNLSTECPMVALSKADGAVYCITIKPYCWSDPSACQPNYGGSAIQTNAAGTIIYIKDERQGLIRLDMRNPNSATQTKLFDGGTEGWVESMVINAAGDAFVKFSSVNNHSSTEFRVYSLGQNSGFTPISTAGENPGCLLNGITSLGNADVYAPQTARTLVLYSRILTGQGRFKEAAYFLDQALQALDLSGVEPEARLRLQASAAKIDLYLLQGKYPEAYSTWNSYRQQKQMSGEPPAFDPAWGVLLHQAGQPKLALELATQSWQKTSVKLTPGSWRRAEVDAFYALALLTNHQQKEASPLLENSLPVLAKAFVGGSNYGHEFMRTKLMLLLDGLAAAIPQHGMNAKLFAPVWQLSEALKYSAVHKAVAASMARNTNNKELSQWIRDEQDQGVLAQNLSKAIENLEANVDGGGQDILVRLREKLDKTEQSRAQLLSRIQAKFPAYAQLLAGMPIPLNELISQLKQGESYLSMLPLPSGVLVMAVNAHGAEKMHFSKLSHDQVQKLTQQLRASIDFTSVPENQILPDYDFESAHSLYANLIEPVQEAIQGNRLLLISTSGDLSSLPLSMWTTRPFSPSPSKIKFESYKQAPWFSLDVDMAYIPSATALVSLRAATASTSKKLTFAGFGDPDFTVNKPSPSSPPAHVGVRASQLLERVSEEEVLLRGPLPEAIPNIPALPETRDEVLSLAKLLGADPSRSVYLGDQASRQNALKKDLSSFNVLAFATHGLIPGDVPGLNQPALALTSQDPTGFLLTAQDILGMRLNADWVILSACNSAAGDGASADALTGLGRSFFYAGSRSVYATHWPVESDSARQLVLKTLVTHSELPFTVKVVSVCALAVKL